MTKTLNKTLLLAALAGLVAAGVADAAGVETVQRDAPTMVVRFSPDSLNTESGIHALYHRLNLAAAQVCPNEPGYTHLSHRAVMACRQQAVAGAVAKIHNQRLAAVHAASASAG
jgi:UrcA family protein